MRPGSALGRTALAALALALALAAAAEWTAAHTAHAAALAMDAGAATGAERDLMGSALEVADRRWPARRDAAFQRARLAAEWERDATAAAHWLGRCEGRIHSRLRWCQLAANVRRAQGDLAGAREMLAESLALDPSAPPSHWRGLLGLSEMEGLPPESLAAIRIRGLLWESPGE
ncbi:MAG: hypothetical protein JXA57_09520 [Armatimonadetes bacterium]|nr:hypothetical protein [Armatimonadota bacterium]